MLTEKICLVLGAGASLESGFPTGRDLIYLVAQEARKASEERHDSLYFSAFDRITVGKTDNYLSYLLKLYSDVLENAYPSSIDEFVVTNQTQYFKEITKLGIAIVLNKFESNANTFEREHHIVGRNETKTAILIPRQNWLRNKFSVKTIQ